MAAEFIDKVKAQFSSASVLMRFIYVNIGVFILLRIAAVVLKMFNLDINVVLDYVSMPSVLSILAVRPWTAITYMFAHYDVWHILFNMLWFYWFGKMFLDVFSPRKFFGLYILGGLGGAALYLICYNILPFFETHPAMLIGASASIIAIVVATAMKSPQRRITLFPFGSFSLKWIAIITIAIDLLSVGGDNAGGHIAHLGGGLIGLWFGYADRRGRDITAWFSIVYESIKSMFKPKVKIEAGKRNRKYHYAPSQSTPTAADEGMNAKDMDDLDAILDKIKQSGYGSLSDAERKRLFKVSGKKN